MFFMFLFESRTAGGERSHYGKVFKLRGPAGDTERAE